MRGKRLTAVALAFGLLAMTLAGCATTTTTPTTPASTTPTAPAFPTKPVEMTILFGAGGSADLVGRQLAKGMETTLKQPVTAVNRTGGGGAIGYTHVSQQSDGYSLVWSSSSISTAHYTGTMQLTYKDFVPVARVSSETGTIVVNNNSPHKTIGEMVAWAKANPGKLKVGNSGIGSFTHLAAAAFAKAAGITVIHVPFGAGLAVSSLLGGQIDASIQLPAEIVSQSKAGQVRVLAVTSEKRDAIVPDSPTLKESNIPMTMEIWRGIHAPKGTSAEVVAILQASIKAAVDSQDFKDAVSKLGATPAYLSAADFAKMVEAEDALIKTLMIELGLSK